ncbi:MAG: hypothetical protein H6918_09865 [Sphingomonadaceae bacterium]|nr:hypothetical protein [Sphingomonadaceae bacterium]
MTKARLAGAALALGLAAPASAAQPIDWREAATAFAAGQERAAMVYTRTSAARCQGRWMLHGDAVDDGAFPMDAMQAFPPELRLPFAMESVEFFTLEVKDDRARRKAADEAEKRLRKAFKGNRDAFRLYFEALGECTAKAEDASDAGTDDPWDAADAPADFDEAAMFDQLKALAGTWQIAGRPDHALRIRFSLTAGGSVLVEEWTANGRPHSLTLYHRNGEGVMATHYCPQGNQPRMALIPDSTGAIRFAFRDVTDLDPTKEQHQHDLWFTLEDTDHITRSETYLDGEGEEHPSTLKLERVKG